MTNRKKRTPGKRERCLKCGGTLVLIRIAGMMWNQCQTCKGKFCPPYKARI
jgi:hypothetical protein